jgi:ankyrin repeat protein
VDVIELLLDNGADLGARTEWGDTAGHYAARHGTFDVLQFLCEEGVSVQKPKSVFLLLTSSFG